MGGERERGARGGGKGAASRTSRPTTTTQMHRRALSPPPPPPEHVRLLGSRQIGDEPNFAPLRCADRASTNRPPLWANRSRLRAPKRGTWTVASGRSSTARRPGFGASDERQRVNRICSGDTTPHQRERRRAKQPGRAGRQRRFRQLARRRRKMDAAAST